jgi:hypothetical protein
MLKRRETGSNLNKSASRIDSLKLKGEGSNCSGNLNSSKNFRKKRSTLNMSLSNIKMQNIEIDMISNKEKSSFSSLLPLVQLKNPSTKSHTNTNVNTNNTSSNNSAHKHNHHHSLLFISNTNNQSADSHHSQNSINFSPSHPFNQFNQINQINQINQFNQIDQINEVNEVNEFNEVNELNEIRGFKEFKELKELKEGKKVNEEYLYFQNMGGMGEHTNVDRCVNKESVSVCVKQTHPANVNSKFKKRSKSRTKLRNQNANTPNQFKK